MNVFGGDFQSPSFVMYSDICVVRAEPTVTLCLDIPELMWPGY